MLLVRWHNSIDIHQPRLDIPTRIERPRPGSSDPSNMGLSHDLFRMEQKHQKPFYWHRGNFKLSMRVCHALPFVIRYSFAYQNVQSSIGSIAMLE